MKLREIMTRTVETIQATASVQEAAKKMRVADVGMLPVLQEMKLVGVITDRDLAIRALGQGRTDMPVREAMSPFAICINQDCEVDEAIEKMQGRQVGRLVVENELGSVVGVVSAADIAIACSGDQRVGRLSAALSKAHRHVDMTTH